MSAPAHNEPIPPMPLRKSRLKRLGLALGKFTAQEMVQSILDPAAQLLRWLVGI